jgi:hypothetical protein
VLFLFRASFLTFSQVKIPHWGNGSYPRSNVLKFSVHKCNLYSWASQAIGNWAHCCAQTVTLHYADCHSSLCVERTDASIPLFRLQSVFYDNLWMVTHDCQMWSDFGYLQFSWRDTKFHPPLPLFYLSSHYADGRQIARIWSFCILAHYLWCLLLT